MSASISYNLNPILSPRTSITKGHATFDQTLEVQTSIPKIERRAVVKNKVLKVKDPQSLDRAYSKQKLPLIDRPDRHKSTNKEYYDKADRLLKI